MMLFSFIFLFACKNRTDVKTPEVVNSTVAQVDTPVQLRITSDSFQAFPEGVEMLLPTQYRKESTGYPKGIREKVWFEIFKDEKTKNWIVAKADLEISYDHDECVGEDVMIIGSKHKNALLFFTPFNGLSEKIETVLDNQPLIPAKPLSFKMNGVVYTLSPSGIIYNELDEIVKEDELKKDEEGNYPIDRIDKYRLTFHSMSSVLSDIFSSDKMQGVTPRLLWAGDLNNDGLPDMILDMSDFYESKHLYFFLSDKNDKEKPLKKLVDLKVVNDC